MTLISGLDGGPPKVPPIDAYGNSTPHNGFPAPGGSYPPTGGYGMPGVPPQGYGGGGPGAFGGMPPSGPGGLGMNPERA
jgi:hypothetical protein